MTNIHQNGRERAINHDVSKSRTLGARILHGLGKIASDFTFGMAPIPGPRSVEKGSIDGTISFLDAQAPESSLTPILDELDARFSAASGLSADDIVLRLVPESSRPDEPGLN